MQSFDAARNEITKKKRSITVDRYSISKARYVHGKTIIQLVWKLNKKKTQKGNV